MSQKSSETYFGKTGLVKNILASEKVSKFKLNLFRPNNEKNLIEKAKTIGLNSK